jgi:hypothetical protein
MSTTTTSTTTSNPGITLSGSEPIILDPSSTKRRPALTETEARDLTIEIQRTSVRLWLLVTEAHDRQAHDALGYDTWDDYVRAEFKMSPSRSYQLIDTGHVMRELAAAGADIDHMVPPTTRVVARIKNQLPAVRKAVREAVRMGASPDSALRTLARAPPAPRAPRGEAEPEQPEPRARNPEALTSCPACGGEGRVSKSTARSLQALLKNLAK